MARAEDEAEDEDDDDGADEDEAAAADAADTADAADDAAALVSAVADHEGGVACEDVEGDACANKRPEEIRFSTELRRAEALARNASSSVDELAARVVCRG